MQEEEFVQKKGAAFFASASCKVIVDKRRRRYPPPFRQEGESCHKGCRDPHFVFFCSLKDDAALLSKDLSSPCVAAEGCIDGIDGGRLGGGALLLSAVDSTFPSSGSLKALTMYRAMTKFTTRTEAIALQYTRDSHEKVDGEKRE